MKPAIFLISGIYLESLLALSAVSTKVMKGFSTALSQRPPVTYRGQAAHLTPLPGTDDSSCGLAQTPKTPPSAWLTVHTQARRNSYSSLFQYQNKAGLFSYSLIFWSLRNSDHAAHYPHFQFSCWWITWHLLQTWYLHHSHHIRSIITRSWTIVELYLWNRLNV